MFGNNSKNLLNRFDILPVLPANTGIREGSTIRIHHGCLMHKNNKQQNIACLSIFQSNYLI